MERVWFVTGAGGFVGSTIVRELVVRGEQVRAGLYSTLTPSALDGVECERVRIDVTDRASLERAIIGDDPERAERTIVVHCAGIVSIADKVDRLLWGTNVEGTQNVLDVCRAAGVRRLVYLSSVHTIPEPGPGQVLVEIDQFDPELVAGAYAQTKAEATRRVLAAADLDRVIVHPTGIMGPGDHGDGAVTRFVRDLAAQRLPVLVAGGYDFVDVRDVADGTIAAALQAESGQCYLLGAERASLVEVASVVAEVTGKRVPRVIPIGLARLVVPFAASWSRLRGVRPVFTNYSLDVVRNYTQVSHAKASADLGYTPRPLRRTIVDTVSFVQRHGAARQR